MSAALNNATTQDRYDTQRTLAAPLSARINLIVANASIYYQLGHGWPGVVWDDDVFLAPGYYNRERDFDAVRVRSALAGVPAQVTIETATKDDVG